MRSLAVSFVVLCYLWAEEAQATSLVAGISDHLVAITSSFAGADLLLFGAIEEPGDIVIVIRGPEREHTLLRKSRVLGLWINTQRQVIKGLPSYYHVASTRPLDEIANEIVLRRYQLGLTHLRLLFQAELEPERAQLWQEAFLRQMQLRELYAEKPGEVVFLGPKLFRATIALPANVPVGVYLAEIYLLQNGQVVSAQTTPLSVSKVGFEADTYDLAFNDPPLYGALAVFIALFLGWLGYLLFRKT